MRLHTDETRLHASNVDEIPSKICTLVGTLFSLTVLFIAVITFVEHRSRDQLFLIGMMVYACSSLAVIWSHRFSKVIAGIVGVLHLCSLLTQAVRIYHTNALHNHESAEVITLIAVIYGEVMLFGLIFVIIVFVSICSFLWRLKRKCFPPHQLIPEEENEELNYNNLYV